MINFEYGGYSFEYNEFQHKLAVKCDGEELLLDTPNFDLGKMPDIYDHLNKYFDFMYHAYKLAEVLDMLREENVFLQKIEETEEVHLFLRGQATCELDVLDTLLGGYNVDED